MSDERERVSFVDNAVLEEAHPIVRDIYMAVRYVKHSHAMALSDGDTHMSEEYHHGSISALDDVEAYIGDEYL